MENPFGYHCSPTVYCNVWAMKKWPFSYLEAWNRISTVLFCISSISLYNFPISHHWRLVEVNFSWLQFIHHTLFSVQGNLHLIWLDNCRSGSNLYKALRFSSPLIPGEDLHSDSSYQDEMLLLYATADTFIHIFSIFLTHDKWTFLGMGFTVCTCKTHFPVTLIGVSSKTKLGKMEDTSGRAT